MIVLLDFFGLISSNVLVVLVPDFGLVPLAPISEPPLPNHHFRTTTSEPPFPNHHFRTTISEPPFPNHHFRLVGWVTSSNCGSSWSFQHGRCWAVSSTRINGPRNIWIIRFMRIVLCILDMKHLVMTFRTDIFFRSVFLRSIFLRSVFFRSVFFRSVFFRSIFLRSVLHLKS